MPAHIPDERGHVVMESGWCIECEAWHPDAPPEIRHPYPPNAQEGLDALPLGQMFVGANRYNTDDTATLHLWTEDGRSFDVRWPLPTWRCPCLKVGLYHVWEDDECLRCGGNYHTVRFVNCPGPVAVKPQEGDTE